MALKLFHTADLHLSQAEAPYALGVLEELAYHCRRLGADAWLLSGDIFDTAADCGALFGDLCSHVAGLGDTPVLMIPGNHELSEGAKPEALAPLAAQAGGGSLRLLLESPCSLVRLEALELELLAVPFQRDLSAYLEWPVPTKQARWRVGLLHGVVNGLTYTGESAEKEHAVIDPHLFAHLGLDYAALGHIHDRRELRFGSCLAHYPGSPRVWRRGECGERRATLVHLDDSGVRTEPVPIEAAGQFRNHPVWVDESGALMEHAGPAELLDSLDAEQAAAAPGSPGALDWVVLELQGFVEAKEPLAALTRACERAAAGRYRRFEVAAGQIFEAERLRGHPLVRAFDARWRARRAEALAHGDEHSLALLQRARRLALEQVEKHLPRR